MHTRATVAALLTTTALLTACTSTTDAAPQPSPSATKTASASPAPSPTKADARPFGTAYRWADAVGAGTTTVIAYTQPVAPDAVQPEETFGSESKGFVWAAVEVKVCLTRGETTVSNSPWSLAYRDGATVDPSSRTYGSFPQPEYPVGDTPVAPGHCVRGKIVFPVPGRQLPDRVLYGAVTEGTLPIAWAVPTK
jgi:hypothetical protein